MILSKINSKLKSNNHQLNNRIIQNNKKNILKINTDNRIITNNKKKL